MEEPSQSAHLRRRIVGCVEHFSLPVHLVPIPLLESLHCPVVGQVELKRRDRDITLRERPDIGSFLSDAGRRFASDPVVRAAARVDALIERVAVDAQALPRDHISLKLCLLEIGNVHIEDNAIREAIGNHLLHYAAAHDRGSAVIEPFLGTFRGIQGNGDALDVANDRLHRGGELLRRRHPAGLQRVPQRLPPLAEAGLHQPPETSLVEHGLRRRAELRAQDGALHLRRGPERAGGHAAEIEGDSWVLSVDERNQAARLLSFLEERAVLYAPLSLQDPEFAIRSVQLILKRLAEDCDAVEVSSHLMKHLKGMRVACRQFLNRTSHLGAELPTQPELVSSLAELRTCLGVYVARVAYVYDVPVGRCLVAILPPEILED